MATFIQLGHSALWEPKVENGHFHPTRPLWTMEAHTDDGHFHPTSWFCTLGGKIPRRPLSSNLVLCPDPIPKRGKGSGTIRAVPCSCWLNSYMTFGRYYAIISNLGHLHVYTNNGGQCKSHVWMQTCNLIGSPWSWTVESAKPRNGSNSARS